MNLRSAIVVSGLPRSGTSLVMQMLAVAGLDLITDSTRPADEYNPRGYFEHSGARLLGIDPHWIGQAADRVVKIVAPLVMSLPAILCYEVIFVVRDLREVAASQLEMATAQGGERDLPGTDWMGEMNYWQDKSLNWLRAQPNVRLLTVGFPELIGLDHAEARRIAGFLRRPLDPERMVEVVDPALWRHRCSAVR